MEKNIIIQINGETFIRKDEKIDVIEHRKILLTKVEILDNQIQLITSQKADLLQEIADVDNLK